MSDVDVSVCSFKCLFDSADPPLKIDTYQRGFVWGRDKMHQLLQDLHDHEAADAGAYYMGTVLLHKNADQDQSAPDRGLFIIDGQQRLTALCLLHHQINSRLPPNCGLLYSEQSRDHIRTAADCVRDFPQLPDNRIFEKIRFTVIRVARPDLAFTFFDTQNNRGVPLHATDLLKAFHLRAINGTQQERVGLQRQCAKRWEATQQSHIELARHNKSAHSLFQTFLWRARRWTGRNDEYASHDGLLDEFQTQALHDDASRADSIPLYRSRHNRFARRLALSAEGHFVLSGADVVMREKAATLPFAIRQPIQQELGFFLYAEKYAALLEWLMHDTPCSAGREAFRDVYNYLLKSNSAYLREIFLVCALVYADQFEDEGLLAFGLWLEHSLGSIRLWKKQVRHERARHFITKRDKGSGINLLDVIANAFTPDQVIAHLKFEALAFDTSLIAVEINKGSVQGKYRDALLEYFSAIPDADLAKRHVWIASKLEASDTSSKR